MVLGLKPMGKPTTWMKKLSFGQNQGIAWSSDSSLWGNQLLGWKNWVFDRTKALHGPQTQAYGETNYLDEKTNKIEFRKVGHTIKTPGYSILGSKNYKILRPTRVSRRWWNALVFSSLRVLFIWQGTCLQLIISCPASSLRFSPRLVWGKYYFSRVSQVGPSNSIKVMVISFS